MALPLVWHQTSLPGYGRWEAAGFKWNLARCLMALTVVASVWGVFTAGLIVLLIYRSTLTMHEDEQLFLDNTNSHMQEEQTQLLAKVNRLTIPVRVLASCSGVFLLVLAGLWISQKL